MLSILGPAAPRRYRTDSAAHIRHVETAAGHSLGQQARHRMADQGILLDVGLDIALGPWVAGYRAYSRLAVEQDKQECCLEAVGIALAVRVTDTGRIQVAVGFGTMGSAAHMVLAGAESRKNCLAAHQLYVVVVRS